MNFQTNQKPKNEKRGKDKNQSINANEQHRDQIDQISMMMMILSDHLPPTQTKNQKNRQINDTKSIGIFNVSMMMMMMESESESAAAAHPMIKIMNPTEKILSKFFFQQKNTFFLL